MLIEIAHRGAMGIEPENTLLSFQKAVELKAEMLEMDVHICKSGEAVIIHDNTVDRTTNGSGYIRDMAYSELRKLDAGKGEKIPRLEEVLDSFSNIKINLELKGEAAAQPVFDIIKKYVNSEKWEYESFYISSFNHRLLLQFISMMNNNSSIKISPLVEGIPLDLSVFISRLNAYSLNISNEFVNSEIISEAHDKGMKVFVYVINDQDELRRMQSLEIDGYFTNYPGSLMSV
ncbi:MAG: glycerophosphodiester phosphodiesterase [Spirochaetes bacterium]|nr:glycerophosphodiester phosphodiesterase [Spirochaetota bacterium]